MDFQKGRIKISITIFAVVLLIILAGLGLYLSMKEKIVQPDITGEILAYHNYNLTVSSVKKTFSDPSAGQKIAQLPNELVVKPGIYEVSGQIFNLNKEGLYRFLTVGKANRQVIIYEKDTHALMTGISWVFTHGSKENLLSQKELEKEAQSQKLAATCGKISSFANELLKKQNVESRIVGAVTNETLNGYDDSHVLIEVKIGGKWRLYDLDNNNIFKKAGLYLNFYEFVQSLKQGDYVIEKIAADPQSSTDFIENNYDYDLYAEETFYSEMALRAWYSRVIQAAYIKEGNIPYYFSGDEAKTKIFDKNFRLISPEELTRRFYQ